MLTIDEKIDTAIELLAGRPAVFSARDVADHADCGGLENSIKVALRENESVLKLNRTENRDVSDRNYLGKRVVEEWWVDQTVRWAKSGLDYLTPTQLAQSMALAFDDRQWDTSPSEILTIGRKWHMLADGCVPGTLVSPWATILSSDTAVAPREFRAIFPSGTPALWLEGFSLDFAINEILDTITDREAVVIRGRFGIGNEPPSTLERISRRYGVTRERIRQIEVKALRKFRHPTRSRKLFLIDAVYFFHSAVTLLIPESSISPWHNFLAAVLNSEVNGVRIPEFELRIIGADQAAVADYGNALRKTGNSTGANSDRPLAPTIKGLQFLSHEDSMRLYAAEKEYLAKQISKTRPRMLYEVLYSLGRAAHFSEIAAECNRRFPERETSIHSWHAALALPESEALGIVWIGRKGMFGLKVHGYSRPSMDLSVAVLEIVEAIFAETRRPVSEDAVIVELSKQRRELSSSSVKMALSFSDGLEAAGSGRYVPKDMTSSQRESPCAPEYDISAAFEAFRTDSDTEPAGL